METDEVGRALSSLVERGLIVWDRGEPRVTELGVVAVLAALEKGQKESGPAPQGDDGASIALRRSRAYNSLKPLTFAVPTSLTDRVKNLWIICRPRLRRALFPKPWPDFTEAKVELSPRSVRIIGSLGDETAIKQDVFALFPDYPPNVAVQQGWLNTYEQYQNFASLVFAHRNRDHPYSELVRANNPEVTDQEIVAIQKGWKPINWIDEEVATLPPRPSAVSRFFYRLLTNAAFLLCYSTLLSLLFVLLFRGVGLNFIDVYPLGIALAIPVLIGVGLHDRHKHYKSRLVGKQQNS